MSEQQIQKIYSSIVKSVYNRKLHKVFEQLKKLIYEIDFTDFQQQYDKYYLTFSMLLEYTFKGFSDPERPNIYRKLQTDLLELAEILVNEILLKKSQAKIYTEKRLFKQEKIRRNLSIASLFGRLKESDNTEIPERKEIIAELFKLFWLDLEFTSADSEALKLSVRELSVNEKSVLVSALTIGLMQHFHHRKAHVLFDFYEDDDKMVKNRALVGIILLLHIYKKRIQLYPRLTARIQLFVEKENISKYIEMALIQITKTKETKAISEKLMDEIIPEVQKFRPKISDKLNLDDILSENLIEDMNPDWEEVFEDAPNLLNKMQEFSEMQISGSDVFMSAFSGLKNFSFFNQHYNWFVPFYKENSDIKGSIFGQMDDKLIESASEGLEKSMFMCNSDKYSFLFNLSMAPDAQKQMIVSLFKAEVESFKEIDDEDKLLNKGNDDKYIFTRYIQDLYRFYNIHPWHSDLFNIFEKTNDIHENALLDALGEKNEILLNLAELNFSKKFYKKATDLFLLLDYNKLNAKSIYEKTGFAFQKLKDYENALKYYQYAEFFDEENQWLIKKIAFCYRKLGAFEKAINYYRKAEQTEPENLHIQANIGHSLLYSKDYSEAFKYYQKVEYFDPENVKVMRPLAWCAFILGKNETSEKYYKKLIELQNNAWDMLHYGHFLFCNEKKNEAVQYYKKALLVLERSEFIGNIEEYKDIFLTKEIEEIEINLLLDYVFLNI